MRLVFAGLSVIAAIGGMLVVDLAQAQSLKGNLTAASGFAEPDNAVINRHARIYNPFAVRDFNRFRINQFGLPTGAAFTSPNVFALPDVFAESEARVSKSASPVSATPSPATPATPLAAPQLSASSTTPSSEASMGGSGSSTRPPFRPNVRSPFRPPPRPPF